MEIFLLEIGLKEKENGWRLITNLVEDDLGSCPSGLRKEISIVLLFLAEVFPWLSIFQVLNSGFV